MRAACSICASAYAQAICLSLERPDFTRHTSRVTHARTHFTRVRVELMLPFVPGVCRPACQADCRQRSPQQRRASDLKTCVRQWTTRLSKVLLTQTVHTIYHCARRYAQRVAYVAYDKTYVVAVCGRAHTLAYKLRMVYTYGNYLSR